MAAVLACGPGAFLSHRSAAALWEIAPTGRTRIDVCSPTRAGRRHAGVAIHWVWCEDQVTEANGIPCATVPLTLIQLAGAADVRRLERAIERAEVLELFDLHAVLALLDRAGRRQGVGRLRRALALSQPELPLSRTELERRFSDLCRRNRLALPAFRAWVRVPAGGFEVDFLWEEQRLIAETDGYRFHSTRTAFETDRRRDQLLLAAGFNVVRFTWRQITDSPREVVSTLRPLLSDRAARGRSRRRAPA